LHQPGILKDTQVRRSLNVQKVQKSSKSSRRFEPFKPLEPFKQKRKMEAVAKLNNYPTSPRKMRLLADLIRGMEVDKALGILQFNPKHPAVPMYKLLKSAINNWEQKNTDSKVEDANLVVKTIMVDGGRVMKRMRPAPQGRGYRVRKRSNHVTLIVDSKPTPVAKGAKKDVAAKAVEVKTEAPAVEATSEKKTRTKRTKKEAETK
jgi:large subunit ribosomal protein L22